jgi:hypothetical protein
MSSARSRSRGHTSLLVVGLIHVLYLGLDILVGLLMSPYLGRYIMRVAIKTQIYIIGCQTHTMPVAPSQLAPSVHTYTVQ